MRGNHQPAKTHYVTIKWVDGVAACGHKYAKITSNRARVTCQSCRKTAAFKRLGN